MDYRMSLKFGMDWKEHDSKRVLGMMVAMNEAEMKAVPKKKKNHADGREIFR